MQNKELRDFILSIIDAKGLEIPSEEVKEQLVADMTQRLLDMIDRETLNMLSAEKIDELNAMMDGGKSDEEVQSFIRANVSDLQGLTAKTMTRFRDAYLGEKRG